MLTDNGKYVSRWKTMFPDFNMWYICAECPCNLDTAQGIYDFYFALICWDGISG